jgi:MFS family permease
MVLLYGAGALVAAPVAGRLSDRLGPIRIMRWSLLTSGLILLLFPVARGTSAIVAMTLALSVASESFRPANLTIMGDLVTPERRKTAFALNRLAINLGMSIGPALGGFLATVSFRWLFVVDGGTAIAAGAILVASHFPPHRQSPGSRQLEEAVAPHLRLSGAHRDRRLLYFLAAMFPVAFVFFQHISSMPIYLVRDLKLSEAAYGLLFTVNTLLIVFLEVGINSATAHWPHRRTLALGAILCGAGFGALAWARDIWQVAATVVVWTFGEMFLFPGMADYLTRHRAGRPARGVHGPLADDDGPRLHAGSLGGPPDPRALRREDALAPDADPGRRSVPLDDAPQGLGARRAGERSAASDHRAFDRALGAPRTIASRRRNSSSPTRSRWP